MPVLFSLPPSRRGTAVLYINHVLSLSHVCAAISYIYILYYIDINYWQSAYLLCLDTKKSPKPWSKCCTNTYLLYSYIVR